MVMSWRPWRPAERRVSGAEMEIAAETLTRIVKFCNRWVSVKSSQRKIYLGSMTRKSLHRKPPVANFGDPHISERLVVTYVDIC